MAEYIKRESVLKCLADLECRGGNERERDIGEWLLHEIVPKHIRNIPPADVVEVRHERFEWGYQNGQYGIWCTNCGAGWTDSENAEWIAHEHDYCPKCGAKMDGKGEGE